MSGQLKWFFETTKNTFSGANDPIHETFRANPYYSLVRESIQNSMDVLLDESKPVEVRFEVFSINQVEHPLLFTLRTHIKSCLDFHHGNKQAQDLYSGMLKYLDDNLSVKILKVSDYNTKGMHYEKDDHLSPFTSFMGEGISSKSSGSGGSFGFGKGAYYVPSELRTILVSTMIEDEKVFFQGRTRLASHKIDDTIKGKDGVFKIDEDNPVSEMNDISPIFRRDLRGTDVYILGMKDDPECGKEMIKSVLNNFWLAVHENRLDVVIKTDDVDVRFDESNLEEIMDEYFFAEKESGPISEIYQWNPKSYYKAVKYAKQSDDFMLFEKELYSIGTVRFYLFRKEGLQSRISFMRKPAMTVYKAGRTILSGYAAVFVCDNQEGNEILRQMENAAHNEWKPENVRYVQKEYMQVYFDAKREINDFINDTLKSISGVDSSSKIDVVGLSDFLSIPEELLDDEEAVPGLADSTREGISSKSITDIETGLSTTINTIVKLKTNKPHIASAVSSAELVHGEDIIINGGGEPNDSTNPNPNPSTKKGMQIEEGNSENTGQSKSYISVSFRTAATKDDGVMTHNLIINSENSYSDVELDIIGGTDNGDEIKLQIISTNNGIINGSKLTGVNLTNGINKIKICFDDDLKHNLKLIAYEA